jgi:hypothetical protein
MTPAYSKAAEKSPSHTQVDSQFLAFWLRNHTTHVDNIPRRAKESNWFFENAIA